jgi:hypothetical protein
MSDANASIADLVAEVRKAAADMAAGDDKHSARMDALEKSVNELYKRAQRPGAEYVPDNIDERKSATEWCIVKHQMAAPKLIDDYTPSHSEIENACSLEKVFGKCFVTWMSSRRARRH